jgi:hypothetical protein
MNNRIIEMLNKCLTGTHKLHLNVIVILLQLFIKRMLVFVFEIVQCVLKVAVHL